MLPSHLSANPDLRQRLEREAKAVSALNHPHICTLYDVGHQDGTDYLVMELVEGETLLDRLRKGPLPLDQTLRYGIASKPRPPRGGGSLSFVTGDLMDAHLCSGPFDVVIERRTLQLLRGTEQIEALACLVARLETRGTFVSHQHSGGCKPGEAPPHLAAAWLRSQGFALRCKADRAECDSAARLACLVVSTG